MKKQRILSAFLALCLVLLCLPVAGFVDAPDVVVSLQINNPMMQINGIASEIDAGRGTTPVVTEGRTLVPIRAIIEAFGGKVDWVGETRTVILTLDGDVIRLGIDNPVAYVNNRTQTLDVAPTVLNERTMLPLRFVAEGFNLGVAWDGESKTVSVIRNSFDESEYHSLLSILPAYNGQAYAVLNGNKPFFKAYEMIQGSFEYYSKQDTLGRCDVCFASVAEDIMPTEPRGSISSVKPSGWLNKTYDIVSGGSLYNRCHLIGFQLTGENANKKNLITGTRYLNVEGMLPFENQIADYVETTGNHVLYRVTPVFKNSNLVADGVLLEAFSVEDMGKGLQFCVYCYNVQPGILIDYQTGDSRESNAENTQPIQPENQASVGSGIYRTPSGKRYHYDPQCGGKNSYETTLAEALAAHLTPCAKCAA